MKWTDEYIEERVQSWIRTGNMADASWSIGALEEQRNEARLWARWMKRQRDELAKLLEQVHPYVSAHSYVQIQHALETIERYDYDRER